jgi:hypothetical protein
MALRFAAMIVAMGGVLMVLLLRRKDGPQNQPVLKAP